MILTEEEFLILDFKEHQEHSFDDRKIFLNNHSTLHRLFRWNLCRKYDFRSSKAFELGYHMAICLLLQFWSIEVLAEIHDHVMQKCNFRPKVRYHQLRTFGRVLLRIWTESTYAVM